MAFKFSFANQYNRERLFDVDTTDLKYYELRDVFSNQDEVWIVEALYINTKGLFDDRPCVVAHRVDEVDPFRCYLNLPAHLCEICREVLKDKNAVAAINAGRVGFTIYQYTAQNYNDRECYSIKWIDIT